MPLYLHIVNDIIDILIKFVTEKECPGIHILNPSLLINGATVEWVILDKTGTITSNNYQINCLCVEYKGFDLSANFFGN